MFPKERFQYEYGIPADVVAKIKDAPATIDAIRILRNWDAEHGTGGYSSLLLAKRLVDDIRSGIDPALLGKLRIAAAEAEREMVLAWINKLTDDQVDNLAERVDCAWDPLESDNAKDIRAALRKFVEETK